MLRVGEDLEPAPAGGNRRAEWLTAPVVAGISRERAATDLEPDAVPGQYPVGGREQLYVDSRNPVRADLNIGSGDSRRTHAADTVHDIA